MVVREKTFNGRKGMGPIDISSGRNQLHAICTKEIARED